MTQTSTDNGSAPRDSGASSFDPTTILQTFMTKISEVSESAENPAAGWLEMNQHWTTFIADRFKQDAALLLRLSKCTSPMEISAAHTAFYKKAVGDYQQEFAQIAELGKKSAGQLTMPKSK